MPDRLPDNLAGKLLANAASPLDPLVKRLRIVVVGSLMLLLFVVVPVMSLTGAVDNHILNRLGRYLALALIALGIDLIWGYTGVLSLCQALFFCLGGYAMAMFLALPAGGGDVRPEYNNVPQFLYFNNWNVLPPFWRPFNLPFPLGAILTLAAVFLLPAVVAGVLGFFIFRSRVRGVYFSIVTQAIAWGAWLAFSRNEMLLGGTNGLTNFYKPLNQAKGWILGLYLLTLVVLLLAYLLCRTIVRSRLGRVLVAVRDKETRLYFAGYRPYAFKLFAFVVAAVLAAVGGALYVPQTGIVTPNNMTVAESIVMVIWVAVGGRGRLWGGILGALVVNFTYSAMTSDLPSTWPFVQGAMFLGVVLMFPDGFVGVWDKLERQVATRAGARSIALTAIPLTAVLMFVLCEMLALTPQWMQTIAFNAGAAGRIQWKYVLLLAVLMSAGVAHRFLRAPHKPTPQSPDDDDLPVGVSTNGGVNESAMTATVAAPKTAAPDWDTIDSHILVVKDVVVSFDGFKALNISEFKVHFNDLRVVIGPNGAGKTTLCDVISGKTRANSGWVYFDRQEITHTPDVDIARRGVGRKFQTPTVFDSLSVYENMELALPGRRGVFRNLWGRETPEQRDQILKVLERVHLLDVLHVKARNLSHGQRQWLEISMLIVASPKLLLVDEPAAGLTDKETELTAELLLELKGEHTVMVIEHDMEFVRRLGSRVTVLNEGQILAEGSMDEVQRNPDVVEAYLGR